MPIIEEIEEIPDFNPPPHHHRQRRGRHADTRGDRQASESVPIGKPFTYSGPRKILFFLLKWIIMTFVLALFLIFIGFAALVVIHFFLTNTAVQHHRRRRGRGRQSPQNSIALPSSSTLSIHDLLPSVGYSAADQTARECAICLEGYKEGDLCRKLPDCSHLFHAHCVDFWLTKKPNCPICRTRVQLDCGSSGSMNNSDDEWKFWWPVGA